MDITGRKVGSYSLKVQQKQGRLPVNLSSLRNGFYLYTLVLNGKPVAAKKGQQHGKRQQYNNL